MTVYNAVTISAMNCKNLRDIRRYIIMCAKSFGETKFSYSDLVDRLVLYNRNKDYISIFAGQSNVFISLAKDSPTVNSCVKMLVDGKQIKEIKSKKDAFYQNDFKVREHGVDPSTIKVAPAPKGKGAA